MKLRELIAKVDRSDKNEDDADIDAFCQALDINEWLGWNKDFDERVKGYALTQWLCTDTHVGMNVYFMDDEPVAVSTQSARKSDVYIRFVSEESAIKVRDFILSLVQEDHKFYPTIAALDDEYGEDYTVRYHSELLTDTGFYGGELVKVQRRKMDYNEHVDDWSKVDVLLSDGTLERIHLSDFKIPYHLDKSNEKEI